MERFSVTPESKLRTPHEELSFLKERLAELESSMVKKGEVLPDAPARVIDAYRNAAPEKTLAKGHEMLQHEIDAVVLDLAPEEHDTQMNELLALLQERGIKNALSVVEKLDNPHVEDDFHRFLAEYLKSGYPATGISEEGPLWRALHMILFSITLPFSEKENREKPLKELLSSMEQLYAGLSGVASGDKKQKAYFSFELAVQGNGEHATIYCAIPREKQELFEKQVLSIFPHAHLAEMKNDYNVFTESGATVASIAALSRESAYALKTYDAFDYDPLNITLSAFAKLASGGEGAALQILIRPTGDSYIKHFTKAIAALHKGVKAKEALKEESILGDIGKGFKDLLGSSKKKDDEKKDEPKVIDERTIESVTAKAAHPIIEVNIRLVASAANEGRALGVLSDLEATFKQFESAIGNSFSFKRIKKGSYKEFVRNFTFRLFSDDAIVPLNLRELATIFHLPSGNVDSSRELKRSTATRTPAPVGLPSEGIVLGVNRHRGIETKIHYGSDDRLRHLYVIGQTGTGKTTLLKNMIVQDIKNGEGVCMIDPHGTDIIEVLANIPPERAQDVIYFDPSNTERPMALNMLEYDVTKPEQKTFVVNELFSIFQKLYGSVPESMGPMFEQYFRNATMLVIEDPETGNTLFDVSRVLSDKDYRTLKLSRCKNPVVVQFWRDVAEKAGGEGALANIVPYITSKFDVFLANDIMRPIVVQPKSTFDFRDIMDSRKILLVNLAKGRLGDINANLLGLIIVGKILMAALSRVDSVGTKGMPPFYLYIDEFQNVTTDSIATILSEARKYKLSLTVAHQFIKQLDEKIKDAVFGNVGSLATFRIGSDDAEYLEKQFAPVFTAEDLMNIDNRVACLKILNGGRPERPFTLETIAPNEGSRETAERLMQMSFARYGRPKADVEAEIRKTYGSALAGEQ
ncbi:MAG: type IV secretory system conjugative DNA transfer family protein [Candidatus Pacebacteria bacterium]|nr:type IV secretory system conjugative DNA transfer family protein [Candidatus Paceibacterota bacterium]